MSDSALAPSQIKSIQTQLSDWGGSHFRRFPWRRKLPLWKGLLVEIMLQRTAAAQVVQPFKIFDRKFPTATSLSALTITDLESIFAPLGLRWRIPLFLDLTRAIHQLNGRLPRSEQKLVKLPGVGPYSSAAALSLYGGVRAVIVDANTVRILRRIIGKDFGGETRRQQWLRDALEQVTPIEGYREFNFALLDFGAEICRPANPDCRICPIQELCVTGRAVSI